MQARMVGSGCGGKLSTWRDWEVDGGGLFILSTGAYRLPSRREVILPRRCGWGTSEWLQGRHPQRGPGAIVGPMAGNTVTIRAGVSQRAGIGGFVSMGNAGQTRSFQQNTLSTTALLDHNHTTTTSLSGFVDI